MVKRKNKAEVNQCTKLKSKSIPNLPNKRINKKNKKMRPARKTHHNEIAAKERRKKKILSRGFRDSIP